MSIDLKLPDLTELRPRITVIGVGGAGGNAVNNMIASGLEGIEFIAANTDAQALSMSGAAMRVQMGVNLTEGLGAGSKPDIGAAAAEEALDDIRSLITGAHMLFITAGMGGGTGTGAAPIIAKAARDMGILTVGVVTKPFEFEGQRRMRVATEGIKALNAHVDTLIVIPNQNLFRVASEQTTFVDAFQKADDVLKSGVACITDLMVKDGLINLDFADVRVVMENMGTALMGTGTAAGEGRALRAAETAILNPLLDEVSLRGAKGLLVSIIGGSDLMLYEVHEAVNRIRREVDPEGSPDINIIFGAAIDQAVDGEIRVSVVATGINEGQLPPHVLSNEPERAPPGLVGRLYGGQRPAEPKPAPLREAPRETIRSAEPVGIEPRPRRQPAPEPATAAPVRTPRRPLTGMDFPELGGGNARPAAASEPRRGLLGWRKRGSEGDGAAVPRDSLDGPRPLPSADQRRKDGPRPIDDETDFPTFLKR